MKIVPAGEPGAWLVVKERDEESNEEKSKEGEKMETIFFEVF